MKSRDFCYWLQGLFEVGNIKELKASQVAIIRQHLNMVFIHEIDPSFPSEQQKALDQAHKPPSSVVAEENDDLPFLYEPGMKC